MIYLHKDMEDIEHILIYDCTTPVGVLKLPFKLEQCADIQDWYYWTERYLEAWANEHEYEVKSLSAKAIKFYEGKYDGRI